MVLAVPPSVDAKVPALHLEVRLLAKPHQLLRRGRQLHLQWGIGSFHVFQPATSSRLQSCLTTGTPTSRPQRGWTRRIDSCCQSFKVHLQWQPVRLGLHLGHSIYDEWHRMHAWSLEYAARLSWQTRRPHRFPRRTGWGATVTSSESTFWPERDATYPRRACWWCWGTTTLT